MVIKSQISSLLPDDVIFTHLFVSEILFYRHLFIRLNKKVISGMQIWDACSECGTKHKQFFYYHGKKLPAYFKYVFRKHLYSRTSLRLLHKGQRFIHPAMES